MPTKPGTARKKLERSHLETSQMEAMGKDYDPEVIKLSVKGFVGIELQEAIIDAEVERTIDGASTFKISLVDHDRKLLRSNRLHRVADVKIDGLWFRLVSVNKNGDILELSFETREVAVLRTYTKPIKSGSRTYRFNTTRAKFILRLIREVKEFKIPWIIPELDVIQKIEENETDKEFKVSGAGSPDNATSRGHGIPHGAGHKRVYRQSGGAGEPHAQKTVVWLTVKKVPMTNAQIDNCNKVLDQGTKMKVDRSLLVMSIMCGIQEYSCGNPRQGSDEESGTSAGFFQEIAGQGQSEAERRDITNSARRFFTGLQAAVHQHPHASYGDLIQYVQRSAYEGDRTYGTHRQEAEKIVTAYGAGAGPTDNSMNPSDSAGPAKDYHFFRGKVKSVNGKDIFSPESSWVCIQRLADEVNWRAFFVGGTFYFMSEDQLFQSKPAAIIDEDSKGIEAIDGEYDVGKTSSELTITARMGQWACPPGSCVQIINCGPLNGKWLVSSVRRSLFNDMGEITVKKPRPRLPEPVGDTAPPSSALTGNVQDPPREPHEEPQFGDPSPLRTKIVAAARLALKHGLTYSAEEPYRSSGVHEHRKPPKTPHHADCSSFVWWCYYAAGAPNPGGGDYTGDSPSTADYAFRGRKVSMHDARPGDICLYNSDNIWAAGSGEHTTVYVGNGKCISVGGGTDPELLDVMYDSARFKMIRNVLGD